MQDFQLDLEKLFKPVGKALSSLRRVKEPDWKRKFASFQKVMDDVEGTSNKLAKSKPVTDDKSYSDKEKIVDELKKLCDKATKDLDNLLKEPVDKNDKKAKVADLPGTGDQLRELGNTITKIVQQIDKEWGGFKKVYKIVSQEGTIELKVPTGMTNMVEQCDGKGSIALPKEQAFEATITVEGVTHAIIAEKGAEFQKNLFGEVGKALEPLKKQVATAFKKWNADFAEIERTFDKKKATQLFASINKHFKVELPKFVEDKLQSAAEQALGKTFKMGTAKVAADYSKFAEFEVTIPENPAKGMAKSFSGIESANKGLAEASTSIGKGCKDITQSGKKLVDLCSSDNLDTEFKKELKTMQRATDQLEVDRKTAEKARAELDKQFGVIEKKIKDNKDAMAKNKDFKTLSDKLSAIQTQMKKIPTILNELDNVVSAARDILKAGDELVKESEPSQEDIDKAKGDIEKSTRKLSEPQLQELDIKAAVDELQKLWKTCNA